MQSTDVLRPNPSHSRPKPMKPNPMLPKKTEKKKEKTKRQIKIPRERVCDP